LRGFAALAACARPRYTKAVRTGPANRIAAATRLLRLAFAGIDTPLSIRLWDGTLVESATGTARVTLAFRSRRAFRRLLAWPTPLRFGEAFIASEIDLEGDVFEALRVTHRLEDVRWSLRTRLAMLREWMRV
jgi:cyclopropane-fatty-acyl-phospholipid synthase